jgi:hypothetical protein
VPRIDLPEHEVDDRLRKLAALSRDYRPVTDVVDMSKEAIDDRLLECAEISALAFELVAAGESI